MEVIICPDEEAATNHVAELIENEVRSNPELVLGLATGRTMELVYAEMARMHAEKGLDFSAVKTFNLDEYAGLPGSDPSSYRYYMNEHLFSKINIDINNTHLPNGTAADIIAECERYEEAIASCGGIDLQLLGIGASGHIGFNEPLSPLTSRTRSQVLAPATIAQNSPLFPSPEQMPSRGITMGVGTILESRRALLLAKAVEGPVTSMISASALQFHKSCKIVVDEDASSQLEGREYYQRVFEETRP
jgi:glucosamine-6-phosphate deaminase